MGRYVIQGFTQIQKLVDPSTKRNLLNVAVMRAVLGNKASLSIPYSPTNMSESIIRQTKLSFANSASKFQEYGELYHPDGLPIIYDTSEGDIDSVPDQIGNEEQYQAVADLISAEIGSNVTVLYYTYSQVFGKFILNYFLLYSLEYNYHNYRRRPYADWYRTYPFSVIGENADFRWQAIGNISFIGTQLTFQARKVEYQLVFDPNQDDDPFNDEDGEEWDWVAIKDENGVYIERTFTFDTNDLVAQGRPLIQSSDILHQAEYFREDNQSYGFWTYDQLDNTYPAIHLNNPLVARNDFTYPIAMLFEDGASVNDGELGENYRQHTKKLLNTLGIELEDVIEAMKDPNDTGNLNDVTDAYIYFAANLNATEQDELSYLYEYYRQNHYTNRDSNFPRMQDRFISDPTDTTKVYNFQSTPRTSIGSMHRYTTLEVLTGNVDTYTTIPNMAIFIPYVGAEIDANNTGSVYDSNGVTIGKVTKQIVIGGEEKLPPTNGGTAYYNNHRLILRKQLTETTFAQLVVVGPEQIVRVSRPRNADLNWSDFVYSNLRLGLDEGQLYIPTQDSVLNVFPPFIQANIMRDCLSLQVQVLNVTSLPWYADNAFISFIRIVLFAFSLGQSETLFELILNIVFTYLIELVIVYGLSLIVEVIGGEAALFLAAIAAATALYLGDGEAAFELLDAESLMQAATLTIRATNEVASDAVADALKELERVEEQLKEYDKELKELNEQLDIGTTLELYELNSQGFYTDYLESPSDFYNRTVHVTNPGVLSIDTIDSYVQQALLLPKGLNV